MRRTAIACEVRMGWKRIVFGAWLIASLAWVNYAILQEFLHPTPWENVFFDPWFWIVSVGLPATALALLLQGITWVVTRIQHGRKRKRRRQTGPAATTIVTSRASGSARSSDRLNPVARTPQDPSSCRARPGELGRAAMRHGPSCRRQTDFRNGSSIATRRR